MKTTRASGGSHAIPHREPCIGKSLLLAVICLIISLSISFTPAYARGSSPFADHLAAPPPFNPDAQVAERTSRPAMADTRGTSDKSEQDIHPDINNLPPPGAGSRKISQAIAASKKDDMIENEWKMGFELRNSPVQEAHGNAERHDSMGGLIKGSMKF